MRGGSSWADSRGVRPCECRYTLEAAMRSFVRTLVALVGSCTLIVGAPALVAAEEPAAIHLSPTSGPPGTSITVSGTNWIHETWASGVPINLYQNYGNGNLKRLGEGHSGPPDEGGGFRIVMTIPLSAEPGIVTVAALTGG